MYGVSDSGATGEIKQGRSILALPHKICYQWQITVTVLSYWNRGIWLFESKFVIEI